MRFLASALSHHIYIPVLRSFPQFDSCVLLYLFHWNSCLCSIPSHLHSYPEIYSLNFILVFCSLHAPSPQFTFLSGDLSPNIDSYPLLYPSHWYSCPLLYLFTWDSCPLLYPWLLIPVLCSNATLIPCPLLYLFHWNSCLGSIPSHLCTFLSEDIFPQFDSCVLLYLFHWNCCLCSIPSHAHSCPEIYSLNLILVLCSPQALTPHIHIPVSWSIPSHWFLSLCSIPHIDIPVLCSISSHLHACPIVCRNPHLVLPVSWSIPSIDACLHWTVF